MTSGSDAAAGHRPARLDEYSGDIIPFDLESGRVYKALMEITIGLTSAEADGRLAAGEQLPRPWPRPHQALIDTGSQHTHVKKDIVDHLGLEPVPTLKSRHVARTAGSRSGDCIAFTSVSAVVLGGM